MNTCDRGHVYSDQDAVVADGVGFVPLTPCPTCNDLSVASDIYKDEYGIRPRISEESLLDYLARKTTKRECVCGDTYDRHERGMKCGTCPCRVFTQDDPDAAVLGW